MAFKALTVNTPASSPAHILAEDDATLYEGIIGGDCVLPVGNLMKATVQSNNKVRISDGMVVVGGHVGRLVKGDYEDMTIANGVSGKKRNDIIAARFIAGGDGGADSYSLVVIQGTAAATATDPVVVKGDLYAGDKQRDYPLWRVKVEGLSIVKVEQLYDIGTTNKDLSNMLDELNGNIIAVNERIQAAYTDNISVNANSYKDVQVKFLKKFLSPPAVIASLRTFSDSPAYGNISVACNNITTQGFTMRVYNDNTSGRQPSFCWVAIG